MTLRPDGREVPDFDTVGVLAPGGGTQGITRAGQAELTRQRFAHTSLPTRALGMALGAAETLVPAAGSPKETLRTLAKAARDYIVKGQEQSLPGFATLGVARTALAQGYATGTAAAAGDPHAQGAALAAVGSAALGVKVLYGRAAEALPQSVTEPLTFEGFHGTRTEVVPGKFGGIHVGTRQAALDRLEATPSLRPGGLPGSEKLVPVRVQLNKPYGSPKRPIDETELFKIVNDPAKLQALKAKGYDGIVYKNAVEDPGSTSYLAFESGSVEVMTPSPKPLPDPLDVPAYQRTTASVRQRFATDAEVRLHALKQRYANHTAETILPRTEP